MDNCITRQLAPESPVGKNRAYNSISGKDAFGAKAAFSTTTCKYCFDIVIFLVVDPINPLSSGWLLSFGKSKGVESPSILYRSGIHQSVASPGKDFLNTLLQQHCSNTFPGRAYRMRKEKDGGLNSGNASIWQASRGKEGQEES